MELIFSTHAAKGKVSKNARIMTNDSTATNLTIYFDANIYGPPDSNTTIVLTPNQLNFPKGREKKVVEFENRGQDNVMLVLAAGTLDNMKTKIKDKIVRPRGKGKIEFIWQGDIPKQSIKHVATFQLTGAKISRITVPYVIVGTEPEPEIPQKSPPSMSPVAKNPAPVKTEIKPNQTAQGKPMTQPGQPWGQPWNKPDSSGKTPPKPVPQERPKTKP